MGFLQNIKSLFSGKKAEKRPATEIFKKRFDHFQALLKNNNLVLEAMADMEDKLSGEYVFDNKYIETKAEAIVEGVKNIIDNLNAVGENRYALLHERAALIEEKIREILYKKKEMHVTKLCLPMSALNKDMVNSAGGKMSNLGEAKTKITLPVPKGFVITSYAFRVFMEENNLFEHLADSIETLNINNYEELTNKGKDIQELIKNGHMPENIVKAIKDEVAALSERSGAHFFSVRSSAVMEDMEFSFAGQYATYLNVPEDEIIDKYKMVVASLFNQRALFYFKTKGLDSTDMVMPVGVLEMIDARCAGVAYSIDPNDPRSKTLIISAAKGLGKAVVDGLVSPDTYRVDRDNTKAIIERCIQQQDKVIYCIKGGGIQEGKLEALRESSLLTDTKITELSDYVILLEKHFGSPQDVEWAIDDNDNIFILQSRPLRVNLEKTRAVPRKVDGYNIILSKGSIAHKGIGFGKAFIVKTDDDLKDFPEGAVLVAKHTSTKFVNIMPKAKAIVTDIGSTTGHMASLAREFRVPSILATEKATKIISMGQEITVDAFNCNVYEGIVEELKEFAEERHEPFKDTPIYKKLKNVLQWIVPLNLLDPDSEQFRAKNCMTMHDITRYSHEMVLRELFDVEYTSADDVGAQKLVAGIPVEIAVLDIGGAIEGEPKYLNPEHLRSIPFNAFLKGLLDMKWPEARAFDVSGLMGAIAHTVTISEEEIRSTAEKSFAFISSNFMSFAIRLGYHFSSIEAYAGDNMNDNYIKFFFKKGGTIADRRLRRVRLICTILKRVHFNVTAVEDTITASLTKYPKKDIETILEILGRLTVYTKQLDMVLFNDMVTDQYIEDFCEQYLQQ